MHDATPVTPAEPPPADTSAPIAAQAAGRGGRVWWLGCIGVVALMMVALRVEGRRWWCELGDAWPWVTDVWSSHCSQHVADPYSITHVSHGLIFWAVLAWLAPRWSVGRQMAAALALAAGWEVLENSPWIIDRYRHETMSLNYMGDSVINSLGDVLSCAAGFLLARRVGLWWSAAVLAATEVILLWLIRDNLTLNVIMLVHPVDAIKAWQAAGH